MYVEATFTACRFIYLLKKNCPTLQIITKLIPCRIEWNRAKVLPVEAQDMESMSVDDAYRVLQVPGEPTARKWLQYDNG